MSASVEEMAKAPNEVAALVKAAKEHMSTSAMLMLMLVTGAHRDAVLTVLEEYKEVGSKLEAALKPFAV